MWVPDGTGPQGDGARVAPGTKVPAAPHVERVGRKVLEIGLDQTEDRAAQVSLMDFGIKSEHKSPEMPRIK